MSNVDALARDWLDAKGAEEEARERRIAIEEQIAAALDAKDEGSITYKMVDHKITLTQPVSRKVDESVWMTIRDQIPTDLWPVKVKLDADAHGMKWLADNEPQMWAKISDAFTSKPGKIGVKVEKIKQEQTTNGD